MAFGLPVLFHNYSHNLLNDKSIIFDYNKANLCFDFNELLNKTKDCLNNTPFLNSLLESSKRVYGNLSDGNVKMRSHKILKDYIIKPDGWSMNGKEQFHGITLEKQIKKVLILKQF